MNLGKKDEGTVAGKMSNKKVEVLFILTAELVFIMLPLVVLTLVLGEKSEWREVLSSSEWSFASCVLFGQSIEKLGHGCVKSKIPIHGGRMAFIMAILIVFGAIPCSLILGMILNSQHPSTLLMVLQGIWFLASLVSYYWFGGIGEYKVARGEG